MQYNNLATAHITDPHERFDGTPPNICFFYTPPHLTQYRLNLFHNSQHLVAVLYNESPNFPSNWFLPKTNFDPYDTIP